MTRYSLLLILVAIGISCNPYKKIVKNPPTNRADSNRLAKVCSDIFPMEEEVVDTIVEYMVDDSTDYYRDIADSLAEVKNQVLTEIEYRYRDTCRSVIDVSKDVCNTCYANGYYEGKKNSVLKTKTVTIRIRQTDTRKLLIAETKLAQTEKRLQTNLTWKKIFMAIAIFELLLIAFLILNLQRKK